MLNKKMHVDTTTEIEEWEIDRFCFFIRQFSEFGIYRIVWLQNGNHNIKLNDSNEDKRIR